MTTPLQRLLAAINDPDFDVAEPPTEDTPQPGAVPPAIAVLHATTGHTTDTDINVILNNAWAQQRLTTYWINNPPVLDHIPPPLRHLAGREELFDRIDVEWLLLSEMSQPALRSDAGTATGPGYTTEDAFTGATVRLRLVSGMWRISLRPAHPRGACVLRVRWANGSETAHPFVARVSEQVVLHVDPPAPGEAPTAINITDQSTGDDD